MVKNKKLVFLCTAFIILTCICDSTATVQFSDDGLVVKAKSFEVSFEHSHYYLVWPFQRFVTIEIGVKNTGRQADTIKFLPPSSIPEGWRVQIEKDISLQPGESGYQKVFIDQHKGEIEEIALNFKIQSSNNSGSKVSTVINAKGQIPLSDQQAQGSLVCVLSSNQTIFTTFRKNLTVVVLLREPIN